MSATVASPLGSDMDPIPSETLGDVSMDQPDEHPEPLEAPPTTEEDEAMDDLFGEDQEVDGVKHEDAESPSSPAGVNERLSSPERMQRHAMEYEEEDAPAPVFEQILEAGINVPNIPLPKSSDGDHWVIRMPNFVKVDSKPFHPETYVGPEQEDEDLQQEASVREKGMTIKLRVENTVRWRWHKDANGVDRRQSNSRIIRWSDGSLSLRLGKELFDITQTIDTSGAVPRSTLGAPAASQPAASQSQTQTQTSAAGKAGLTYLVAQHKRAFILQSQAVITGHMSLRPTGMQSETHRMLVRAVGQKHNKVARLRMAPDPTRDPERELMEEMKRDAKRPRKPRVPLGDDDDMDLGAGTQKPRRKSSSTGRRHRADMWSDEDEEEDEPVVFSDEEDYNGRRSSPKKSKGSEPKRAGEYVTDDFVVSDEENASEEEDTRRKKRRHVADEASEDELDMLDAKIARQEEQRQRNGSEDEDAEGSPVGDRETKEMDVESDEDDDFKVRRAGAGRSKRRAIQDDDDDDDDDE